MPDITFRHQEPEVVRVPKLNNVSKTVDGIIDGSIPVGGGGGVIDTGVSIDAFEYTYVSNPAEPPNNRQIRFPSVAFGSVTKMWVSHQTVNGFDPSKFLASILVGDDVAVQDRSDSSIFHRYNVTAPVIDKGGYTEIPIAHVSGSNSFLNNKPVMFAIVREPVAVVPASGGVFTGDISVPDEAYSSLWDGSAEVPTKNAVYDEMETKSDIGHTHPGLLTDGDKGDVVVSGGATAMTVESAQAGFIVGSGFLDFHTGGPLGATQGHIYFSSSEAYHRANQHVFQNKAGDLTGTAISTSGIQAYATWQHTFYNNGVARLEVQDGIVAVTANLKVQAGNYLSLIRAGDSYGWRMRAGTGNVLTFETGINGAGTILGAWTDSGALTISGSVAVNDEAYGPTWDGSLQVPTKNALYDKIEGLVSGGGSVSDVAYGLSWNSVATVAPSKNAVYDQMEVLNSAIVLKANSSDLANYIPLTQKGAISGVCPLDGGQKVAAAYLPSYVDDVVEYANLAAFPATGETGKIYIALDTNFQYRWSGSAYVKLSDSAGAAVWGAITGTLSAQTDLQTALNAKANKAGETFTGAVSVPDDPYAVGWDGSLQVPTKNAVYDKIQAVVATIPAATTSIVGITGTLAQFDVALTDHNFAVVGRDNNFTTSQSINAASAQLTINPSSGSSVLDMLGAGGTQALRLTATIGVGNILADTLNIKKKDSSVTYGVFSATGLAVTGTLSATGAVSGSNLSGTNTGDQTSIAGITGTIAQFNAACTDADFATGGGTATGTNTGDQTTVSGNAGTATALATSRNFSISGSGITAAAVGFNGTANVVLAASVDAGHITLARMANLAANSIIGNNTGAGATPLALTGTQVTAMLDVATTSAKGVVLPPGGTVNFLRADGTWAAPPGGGGLTDGDKGDVVVSGGGTVLTVESAAGNFVVSGGLKPTAGQLNTGTYISRWENSSANLQAGATGAGLEIYTGGGASYLSSYNRTSAGNAPLFLASSDTQFTINAVAIGAIDASGINLAAGKTFRVNGVVVGGGSADGLGPDGDKGDVTVGGTGTTLTIDAKAVTLAKMADVATGTVFYRKTAATGVPEVQTLATLKTDLGISTDIAAVISDTAYGLGWNGVTTIAPSKNAVYDQMEVLNTALVAKADTSALANYVPKTVAATNTVESTGGSYGKVKLSIGSIVGMHGALFETDASIVAGVDLVDFAFKSAGGQSTMRYERRTGQNMGAQAWEFQFDAAAGTPPVRLGATYSQFVSPLSVGYASATAIGAGLKLDVNGKARFIDTVTVPDDAYAAGWDGNLTVPTKNAVYDKIQSMGAGGADGLGPDGDKGDITVGGTGTTLTIDAKAVSLAKMADVATGTVFYRRTAATGVPEVQTLATLKTDLGIATDLAAYLPLAGGTLTGNVIFSLANPTIYIRPTGATNGFLDIGGGGTNDGLHIQTVGFNSYLASDTFIFRKRDTSATWATLNSAGLALGNTTGAATATPVILNMGGTYSNVAGANHKLQLYNDGSSIFGIGISSGSMDFTVSGASAYNYYVGATKTAAIDGSGINLPAGMTYRINGVAIGGGVTTFNTRSGAVVLTTADVTAVMPAFTGDVTNTAGGTVNTIAAGAVTYAKMQNVSVTNRIMGRNTAGAGSMEELTGAVVLNMIAAAPESVSIITQSTSLTVTAATHNNSHIVFSGATRTLTLGNIAAGVSFTGRFTTAWAITCSGGLSKNGAAPVANGNVAANSLISFLHEGAGVWVASGGGLT